MNLNHLQDVLKDESFVNELMELETPNEVQSALKEKGIDIAVDDIEKIKDFLIRYQQGQLTEEEKKLVDLVSQCETGELDEEQLESVSGGFIEWIFVGALAAAIAGITIGGSYTAITGRRW